MRACAARWALASWASCHSSSVANGVRLGRKQTLTYHQRQRQPSALKASRAPLLSIAYPTKDEADEAHAKIAEALEKAVEVGQPGRVAKESAEVTQGPSLWR